MTGRAGHTGSLAASWLRGRSSEIPSGVAVLAAGSMLAALGLSACGPDVAAARTVLHAARAATLELADGSSRPATEGMTVPKGATVRTAPGGSASLVAAGRTVLLGSETAVAVVDGERETLRQGLVMVDARRSPGLSLAAGAATVQTPRGGLTRIERGVLLRAASFRDTLTVRATGRRGSTSVDALHQVQVPDGGVPGRVTPLALTRDRWERRYALDLVTADTDLGALADGLDRNPGSSTAVLAVLPASYAGSASVAGASASETALAFVVAKAAGTDPEKIRNWRSDGGSWGVVAALAGADVAKVSAALDGILKPSNGPVVAVGPGNSSAGPTGPGALTGGGPSTGPSGGSGGSPKPRPSSKPSPSSDPVGDVVGTVTGLLPTPAPTPTPITVPIAPSPSPLVKIGVGGVTVTVG
jgi:hypothetical protein